MSATKRGDGDQPKADSCGHGGGGGLVSQMWMSTFKKKLCHFFIIIWKYFLSNINSIFEYSELDKIRLDCKVYPSPPHTHTFCIYYQLTTEAKILSNLSLYIYLTGCKLE